jgi:hypothetical protein
MKLVALILATVLALTGCGKQEVSESSPAINEIEEPQVLTLLLMYDGFEEDYLSHYEYRGILINGEEQTSFDGNEICYNTIGNHLDECAEFFEANKNQAVEDEVNLRLTTYTEVTDWFPSSFSILTDEGEKSYEISKVLMRVSTTGVTEEEKDKIKISDLMPNQYGAYSYANSLHFWLFGRETDGAVEEEFTDSNFSLASEETEESSEESTEETTSVEVETEHVKETTLEINMSDYLKSKEIIWLELDSKELSGGGNPTESTHVVGILVTKPDGTLKEARTTVSDFGTLGEFSKKTDKEIKKIADDFINDFSNYEMIPCMSDTVKKELQKYIASPHHYTLTGVDVNEWRNIKNYLVLSFESNTPEILNYGDMRKSFSLPANGGNIDFEYGVKQQNISFGGSTCTLQINDSFYAIFRGEQPENYPMVVRDEKDLQINKDTVDSPNVVWNPDGDLYPEKVLIKESEYIDDAMLKESPVKYSSFIRKD